MASSNAWAAVALVLISALSASAQSSGVGCFITGECYGGSIAGVNTGVDSADDCNAACKDQSTCKVGCCYTLLLLNRLHARNMVCKGHCTGPEKMVCKTYLRRTQAGPSRRVM